MHYSHRNTHICVVQLASEKLQHFQMLTSLSLAIVTDYARYSNLFQHKLKLACRKLFYLLPKKALSGAPKAEMITKTLSNF